jgi:hypothetical protein
MEGVATNARYPLLVGFIIARGSAQGRCPLSRKPKPLRLTLGLSRYGFGISFSRTSESLRND